MIFDDNDLLAAFDQKGNLINSALLRRPLSITNAEPIVWTEGTANKVYNAWDGRPVSIYKNKRPGWIEYYGITIDDSVGYYRCADPDNNICAQVDLHKEEATNGCIFIKDPNTPQYADTAKLNAFEPQFIKDIQKIIGTKEKRAHRTFEWVIYSVRMGTPRGVSTHARRRRLHEAARLEQAVVGRAGNP